MEAKTTRKMYRPPQVRVVSFQIESGFAGSGGDDLGLLFFTNGVDNTTAYNDARNSGDAFWDGGTSTAAGSAGTSSYGDFTWGW